MSELITVTVAPHATHQIAHPAGAAFGMLDLFPGQTFEATRAGRPVELSPREFKMLKYFVEHRGEVVTRDQLLDHVWGYEGLPLTRTVDMHIAKLRQKIEDVPSDPRYIITVHRVGYKFTG